MQDSALLSGALRHFRARRMRQFENLFHPTAGTRILDVGGSPAIWDLLRVRPRVTIANLPTAVHLDHRDDQSYVAADGCQLPFADQSFDIVFSNSVIEHVGSAANQQRFASEVARVGRGFWVQTPNRRAPIEMHVMLPFVHLLPKLWRSTLVRRVSLWEFFVRPTEEQKDYFYNSLLHDLRLLSERDLRALFPGARIINERFLGLPKSLLAVKQS